MLRALLLLALATFAAAFAPAGVPLRTQRLVPSMAHKKGAGSTKNGRDSNSKRLGLKVGHQLRQRRLVEVIEPLASKCLQLLLKRRCLAHVDPLIHTPRISLEPSVGVKF